jgi:hypothetical protein
MNLGQLRKALNTAASHYRSDGQKDIADALSLFATNLIIGDDSQTVTGLVSRIKKAQKPTATRSRSRSGRRR